MKKAFVCALVLVAFMATSCTSLTVKMDPSYQEFEKRTTWPMKFIVRGLYSVASQFKVEEYKVMQKEISNGNVELFVVDDLPVRLEIEKIGEKTRISLRSTFAGYADEAKLAYVVAMLASASTMKEFSPATAFTPEDVVKRFYEIIRLYSESGYKTAELEAEPWYAGKKMIVTAATIE